ncbi:MAG: nicotinate (nicotinamide) nucleotide adenylyltransferase [Nitratiruptor sp.]|nr:nicotinate (nicotinamide) nucleotide adenylyltransferase [Nitratiruptor sp.]NPA83057.1 nicotinate (nicotinamide) nucleotide adenylyltransferase [Campylobacterota bacterium]
MEVAIFGGSFDPPHKGHLAIVTKALETLPIHLLFVVPTYRNPFKERFFAPPHLRLAWLKKLFANQPKVRVLDFEIRRQRPVYTIETVAYIKRRWAPKRIYLLIGSDNLASLPKWKAFPRLRKEVTFIVFTRGRQRRRVPYRTIPLHIPISSTQLRSQMERRLLPPRIARSILNFYRQAARARRLRSGTSGGRAGS